MTDYVAQVRVQMADEVSQNARAVTTSLGQVSDSADKVTQSIGNADAATKSYQNTVGQTAPALGNVNSAFGDYVNKIGSAIDVTGALSQINDKFEAGLASLKAALEAGNATIDETAKKEQALADQRDAQSQAVRRQSQAVAQNLGDQTSATQAVTASTDDFTNAQDKLLTMELSLYTAMSGGKVALTALAESLAKSTASAGDAGNAMGTVGGVIRAMLTPLGLATTAMVGLGVVAYEVYKRSSDLDTQQRTLTVSLAATGRTAVTSAAQLQGYADALKAAGVSSNDANTIANNLARTPGLTTAQASQISSMTPDLAAALGTGDIDAQKRLTEAVQGSADAIKALDTALNFLTPDQAANVATMIAHGEKTAALDVAMKALQQRIDGLRTETLSPTDQAFLDMRNHWTDFIDSVAKSSVVQDVIGNLTAGFHELAVGIRGATAQEDLVSLTNQAAKLQFQIAQIKSGGGTSGVGVLWGSLFGDDDGSKALQAQLDAVQQKIADVSAKSAQLRTATKQAEVQGPPIPNALTPEVQKALFTTAQTTVDGTKAGQIATLTQQNKEYTEQLTAMGARTTDNATRFDTFTAAIAANQATIDKLNEATKTTTSLLDRQLASLDSQITEYKALTEAYKKGYDQVALITEQQTAEKDAIRDGLTPGTQEYTDAIKSLTEKLITLQSVKAAATVAQDVRDAGAEADSVQRISAAYDGTTLSISNAENAEKARSAAIRAGYIPGTSSYSSAVNDLSAAYDRGTAASVAFAQQQASVQALATTLTNAFDQIGSSIVSAFTSGSGSAINFGAIFKTVVATVLSEIAKLAIINPIINSLLGTNSPTLSSAINVLSSGSGGSGSAAGSSGGLSSLVNLSGIGNTVSGWFGGPTIGSFGSSIGSTLGLTGGGGGSFSVIAGPGVYAGDSALLGDGSFSVIAGSGATSGGFGVGGGLLSSTIGGASLGSWAGGIGAGFAGGSILGGYLQNGMGKVGPAPEIGAAVGAVGGAAIGTILLPGIGTIAGGLIGGLIGGAGGSIIGPHAPSVYGGESLTLDANGNLIPQDGSFQGTNKAAIQATAISQTQALNYYDQVHDIKIASAFGSTGGMITNPNSPGAANPAGIQWIGQGKPGDANFYSGLDSPNSNGQTLFSKLTFASADNNPILNDRLQGKTFNDTTALDTWVKGFEATQAAATNFVTGITAQLKTFGVQTGSLNDTIAGLNKSFDDTKTAVDALKTSGYLTDAQVQSLTDSETQLAAARDKAIAKATALANAQTYQTDVSLNTRLLQATPNTHGTLTDAEGVALYSADASAAQERTQFAAYLTATYGDAYASTSGYADQMALLEKTLGAERVQIVTSYSQQIIAAQKAVANDDLNLNSRYLAAASQISGKPADAETAALYSFDTNAQAQRDARSQTLIDLYGPSITASAGYAAEMALLEKTLGEERLAIVKSYSDQIVAAQNTATQAAATNVVNIASYLTKLQTSSASPLSPSGQLNLAENQFDALSAKAKTGDYTAISGITGSADTLLNASRAVYGSGKGYVADFNKVLDSLSAVTQVAPDTLTASAFAAETQTQTQTLVTSLAAVKAELVSIRLQLQQGANKPVQVAA